MSLIIKQLEMQQIISPEKSGGKAHITRLAENAWLWRVQYRAHCAHLVARINQSTQNSKETKKIIQKRYAIRPILNWRE